MKKQVEAKLVELRAIPDKPGYNANSERDSDIALFQTYIDLNNLLDGAPSEDERVAFTELERFLKTPKPAKPEAELEFRLNNGNKSYAQIRKGLKDRLVNLKTAKMPAVEEAAAPVIAAPPLPLPGAAQRRGIEELLANKFRGVFSQDDDDDGTDNKFQDDDDDGTDDASKSAPVGVPKPMATQVATTAGFLTTHRNLMDAYHKCIEGLEVSEAIPEIVATNITHLDAVIAKLTKKRNKKPTTFSAKQESTLGRLKAAREAILPKKAQEKPVPTTVVTWKVPAIGTGPAVAVAPPPGAAPPPVGSSMGAPAVVSAEDPASVWAEQEFQREKQAIQSQIDALKAIDINALPVRERVPKRQEIGALLQPLEAELAKYNNLFGKDRIIKEIKKRYRE